ncbi:MAG: metalloregulator ArsR/SmtB family transcription factor [Gammaproteobacteria bacterium]|nr:metalloregulator ArsR/SmtB family transcription factor [Gammaproteobacteria bacterium]
MNIDHENFFKMLADRTRMRALMLMQSEDELCVCELTHALKLSQPKISRHLAQLREAGLVRARREGLWMYYRINPALPAWALAVLKNALTGSELDKAFRQDHTRLQGMQGRPGTSCCA